MDRTSGARKADLDFVREAAERAEPKLALFTQPAQHFMKDKVLRYLLPKKHVNTPLPEMFYQGDVLVLLREIKRGKGWCEWQEMSIDEIAAELMVRALAA